MPKKKKSEPVFLIKKANYCLYGICFDNPPICIDSTLEQTFYNGILLKIYNLKIDKSEVKSFDTLINKGFNRLPFKREDMSEIPLLLKNYIDMNDIGFYQNYIKNSFGNKFIILNLSKNKLILYDFGILEDLLKEDHENGTLQRN